MKSEIEGLVVELDVKIRKVDSDRKGHVRITIEGSDDEFVASMIAKEYGLVPEIHEIIPDSVHSGQLVDVGKVGYGLYVDIGITEPKLMDALVPLHQIRDQFSMPNSPLRKISKSLVLVENLPVKVSIVKVDMMNQKIEAEFTDSTINRFIKWSKDDHERLLVFGANHSMLERALLKSSHSGDIYSIEQLGPFEYSLRCKRTTRASGILAAIGPHLRGVPMHLFIPEEVGENQNAET
jgi:hypothetical protein